MILTGPDAVRFHEELTANKDKQISQEEIDRIKKLSSDILRKSKMYIITAELRDITDSWLREEISYSKMVELINEIVHKRISKKDND